MAELLPLDWAWAVVLYWLLLAGASLLLQNSKTLITNLIFPLGALGALAIAAVGIVGLIQPVSSFILPIGLPDLPFHLRLDALSAFFLVLLGGAAFGVTVYSIGYFKGMERGSLALLALWYHLFLAGMTMVLLADDAYAFMVAWEVMALSSYFLVTTDHDIPDIRRAGFLYLLIAHVGAVSLLLCFGVLQGGGLESLRRLHLQHHAPCRNGRRSGLRWSFCWRCSASVPRPVWCRIACLAAGGAPGGAVTGFGADVWRHAEDRNLRPAARHFRSAECAAGLVGHAGADIGAC
jgi:NADH:ubiquinone oxidoreductase subunit 5 (subunit L)/multisubunit Na+/H+ antiporter MnhA subunit